MGCCFAFSHPFPFADKLRRFFEKVEAFGCIVRKFFIYHSCVGLVNSNKHVALQEKEMWIGLEVSTFHS